MARRPEARRRPRGRFDVATSAGKWFSAAALLRACQLLQGAVLLLPLLVPSTASLLIMMLAFGATSGARTILRPLLIVELFGSAHFATNSGLLQAVSTLAKSGTPVGFGVAINFVGFDGAWSVLSGLAFASGLLLLLLPTPASFRTQSFLLAGQK